MFRRVMMVLLIGLLLFSTPIALAAQYADDVVGNDTPPAEAPVTVFPVKNTGDAAYVPPTNTGTDSVTKYYYVTQDPTKSAQHNTAIGVTYNGIVYTATLIYTPTKTYTQAVDGIDVVGACFNKRTGTNIVPWADNNTYFFDRGNFVDENYNYNYQLSGSTATGNRSTIGLFNESDGAPATVFYKLPYPVNTAAGTAGWSGYMARIMFNHTNAYLENITFDGSNIDMIPVGSTSSGITSDRGEFFFFLSASATGFVARDLVFRNIGADNVETGTTANGLARKNVAIYCFKVTSGQRNFENLTFINVKTKSPSDRASGVIMLNQSSNCYFKDIDMSQNTAMAANAYPVRIDTHGTLSGPYVTNSAFAGALLMPTHLPQTFRCVSVIATVLGNSYRHANLNFPAGFDYVACPTSGTGSATSSTTDIKLYNSVPIVQNAYAYLELPTGYWFVNGAPSLSPTPPAPLTALPTLTQQLASLNSALAVIRGVLTAVNSPRPYVKIIGSSIPDAFTIPDLRAAYNNSLAFSAHLVALTPSATPSQTLRAAGSHASGTDANGPAFVPYTQVATTPAITFPTTAVNGSTVVSLYNVNFKDPQGWTIDDGTGGMIADFAILPAAKSNSGHNLFRGDEIISPTAAPTAAPTATPRPHLPATGDTTESSAPWALTALALLGAIVLVYRKARTA